jgi:inorganic pyrophosphatase
MTTQFLSLNAFNHENETINVIIDTPKNSRNKFKFDEKTNFFKLGGVLPVGAFFPFDFGYIPSTLGGDGDPLDVLVLMDEPAFVGCLVEARLIGVIEADQTERDGKVEKNDRLIAVAEVSANHKNVQKLNDLNENLIHEIEHFFVSYNTAKGKKFEPTNRADAERAKQIVQQSVKKSDPN